MFRLQVGTETKQDKPGKFNFTKFHGQELRSPSPEPSSNEQNCSPIPEETVEEGEITESESSQIASPVCVARRQHSAEIEEIENNLLNGESPAIDFGCYRVEGRLLDSGNEREQIKDGYRHLTIGELKAKLASKSRRAKRVCQHIHELEEAVLFLQASRRYLKKIETEESVLEELIASHKWLRWQKIGLCEYRFGGSLGDSSGHTTRSVHGA